MWDKPIIVTGCARSGTSMVAGVLHLCGAWIGQCTGSTRWNQKGQFENEFIRDVMTKPYLKAIGADPMGQNPLPKTIYKSMLPQSWAPRVKSAIRSQGYKGDLVWMFKGAKACLIWEVWNNAFPEAQWVIVRREDEKIIDSCMKTSFMRKRSTREEWQEWIDFHKEKFRAMNEAMPGRVWEIWPALAFDNGPEAAYRDLVGWLGLGWEGNKVSEFIDNRLWSG